MDDSSRAEPGASSPLDQSLRADLRLQALAETVAGDPDFTAVVVDAKYRSVEPPPQIAAMISRIEPLPESGIAVSPATLDNLLHALADARRTGGAACIAARSNEPDVMRRVKIVDLVDELGVVVVIFSSAEVEHTSADDLETVAPRIGRMHADITSVVLAADEGAVHLLGYKAEDLIGHNSLGYLHPDDVGTAMTSWLEMIETEGATNQHLLRYRRADDTWMWAEVSHRNLLETKGYVEREFIDVSDRILAIVDAENKGRLIDGIADVLPSGIAHFDTDQSLLFANDLWRTITGDPAGRALHEYADLVPADDRTGIAGLIRGAERHGRGGELEITVKPADGSAHRRCRLTVRSLTDSTGGRAGTVACLDDITEAWRLQSRLVEQATSDALTGLSNRGAIIEYLDDELQRIADTDVVIAVVFIDLNDFKRVNDVLGHGVGDGLIQQIGESLKSVVRANDVAARHGGDEFLIVLSDLRDIAMAMRLARRLLDAATGRFYVDGHTIESSASCGVSVDVGGHLTAERLIAQADLAMYEQKRSGGQDPALFESTMFEEQRHELTRDSALRQAATDDSLVLHYQPIVEMGTGMIVGYEALLRWMFEGKLVAPDSFIGLAERRGLINEIGAWVLDNVVARAAQDPRRDLLWTLNVSPVQLRDGSFDMLVASSLTRHGLEPSQLGLELTEGVLVARSDDTNELLSRLSDMGVSLMVDDFGTGYASLDYLRTLPVHGLKVDRCFTADVLRPRTNAIIGNVVSLAQSLGLRLVVEGVETHEQCAELLRLGAVTAQGYLFGKPEPLEDQPTAVVDVPAG